MIDLSKYPVSEFVQGLTPSDVLHEVPIDVSRQYFYKNSVCDGCHFNENGSAHGNGGSCTRLGLYDRCENSEADRSIIFVSVISLVTRKLTS